MIMVVIDSERNRQLNPELIGYIIKPGAEWKANMDVRKLTYDEESFWEMHQDKDVSGPAVSGAIQELLDEMIERVNKDVHNDLRQLAWQYIKELLTKEVSDRDLPKLDFKPKDGFIEAQREANEEAEPVGSIEPFLNNRGIVNSLDNLVFNVWYCVYDESINRYVKAMLLAREFEIGCLEGKVTFITDLDKVISFSHEEFESSDLVYKLKVPK